MRLICVTVGEVPPQGNERHHMSIRTKIKFAVVSAISIAAIGGSAVLATGASAATTGQPTPAPTHLPRACAVHTRASDNLQLNLGVSNFNYQVRLRITPELFQRGVYAVNGTLCDTNEPIPLVLPVHGVLFGHGVVVLSVVYPSVGPDAGNQGVRTFSGVIGPFGQVNGAWTETGTEAGSGLFHLQRI